MTVVCQTVPTSSTGIEELLDKLQDDLSKINTDKLLKVKSVRRYEGKRVAKDVKPTLFSTGGKRLAKKKKFDFGTFIKRFNLYKGNRVQKKDRDLSIFKDIAIKFGHFALNINDRALNYVDDQVSSFMGNEYIMLKSYFNRKKKALDRALYKAKLEFYKKYAEIIAQIDSITNGKRASKSKLAWMPAACLTLALTLGVTAFASFGGSDGDRTESEGSELSSSSILLADGIQKEASNTASSYVLSDALPQSILAQNTVDQAILEAENTTTAEDTDVAVEDEVAPEVEIQDGIKVLDAEEEQAVVNELSMLDASKELTLTISQGDLQYFNPNEFYRCPDDVTTEELLAIFGITPNQFYNEWFGTITNEAFARVNGYNEAYWVAYIPINRICHSNWLKYGNIYGQIQAPGQFSVWLKHTYSSYEQYPEETRAVALQAIRDAMYNFIVDPTHAPHEWDNFRANGSWSFSSIKVTENGNHYETENHNYTVIYPDFLQSEAAIALRNRALGISDSAVSIADGVVYDYETNTIIVSESKVSDATNEFELGDTSTGIENVVGYEGPALIRILSNDQTENIY